METESRKNALHYFFDKVVGPMGFKFTPDVELLPAGSLPRTERKAKRLFRTYRGEQP